jgi:hypothetical protein
MKRIILVFVAFALSAVTHQAAYARDWGVQADVAAPTVVVCDNSGCAAAPQEASSCSGANCAALEPLALKVVGGSETLPR